MRRQRDLGPAPGASSGVAAPERWPLVAASELDGRVHRSPPRPGRCHAGPCGRRWLLTKGGSQYGV